MAVNKILDRNGNSILDLSQDGLTSNTDAVLNGLRYHGNDGRVYVGTRGAHRDPDIRKVHRFFDYDGTLLYTYTVDEIQALTELPAAPDHTLENLTFQEWNWTLEDLKALDYGQTIGAHYITSDGKTYLETDNFAGEFDVILSSFHDEGAKEVIVEIDWGDGSTSTETIAGDSISRIGHFYEESIHHNIVINPIQNGEALVFGTLTESYYGFATGIVNAKVGKTNGFGWCNIFIQGKFEKINVPKSRILRKFSETFCLKFFSISSGVSGILSDCFNSSGLEEISIPRSCKSFQSGSFYQCINLKNIILHDEFTNKLEISCFRDCLSLSYMRMNPINIFHESSLTNCNFKELVFPEGTKRIDNYNITTTSHGAYDKIVFPNSIEEFSLSGEIYTKYIKLPVNWFSTKSGGYMIGICPIYRSTDGGGNAYGNMRLTIDISDADTVFLNENGDIPFTISFIEYLRSPNFKILVKNELLEDYKNHPQYETYRDHLFGV